MILGISMSGRPDGITSEAVKSLLKATGIDYDYVSLAGKRINGCIGCTLCAADNRCVIEDDWSAIGEKMLMADAIVFGAPNYFGTINALGHACLERMFCFRHRDAFRMAGKLGVIISVDYKGTDEVLSFMRNIITRQKMVVVDEVKVRGYSQCYTCGFGHDCASGNVVKDHGFLDAILPEHLPKRLTGQPTAEADLYKIGKMLGAILKSRPSILF
ncbi:MAG: flavodoxin family protein [Sporomusaceae bacterium]|nr:flavodoxin family protein [Sporomusaceae bacterium]